MKFLVTHGNGKTKIIEAKNLDDAEKKCGWKNWEEIKDLKYV